MSADAGTRVSVAPMLSVRNGAAAVEFYKAAFGAAEVFRIEDPAGAVVARLSVDGGVLAERRVARARQLQPRVARRRHRPDDPDRAGPRRGVREGIAAGAREVVAVEEDYGWRLGRVVDPFGHHWEIGRPLAPDA